MEFGGVVLSTPKGATTAPKFPVGARVFGAAQGAYATHLACGEASLLPVPEGWTFAQAAGLFVTAPTAFAALTLRASVRPGETVLVHAAAGGVGLAAVQVAKALGATVIATASTEHKRAVARSFGADHAVSYADPKTWPAEVRALTPGGRGVDVVFDPVGAVDLSTKCTAWNGRIVVVGFAAGSIEKVAMNKVLLKNISLVGLHWGAYVKNEPQAIPGVWEGILRLVRAGKYRGTEFTDREFVGLDSVSEALVALGGRETWGKVVVKIPQEGGSKL
ncbi:uncharacterized protein E0L32_011967 [Thyridium curvatum]|uniref:Enoyl reductase (ER) domain-containing protein n=1 Tax=Thyridium curvatum TaxID=1093900 RepID=A0A507BF58_9PEZI|nr:uncharacterized protein E0L32_011967 [Thyridium curvatum]TPX17966.1 hypothetical protein E0L32_011967 [Thyridium curvatum]